MKRIAAAILSLLVVLFCLSISAEARRENMGEGYTPANYKDVAHTLALMGGVDMNRDAVADDFARIFYCPQFKTTYSNDLEWHKIRSLIVTRVLNKQDHLRTLYEIYGVFKLGRYDVESQLFPLIEKTAMVNVGTMDLFPSGEYQIYCNGATKQFPFKVELLLEQPLTLTNLRIPMDQADKMIARMNQENNAERNIYGRIRFRVTGTTGVLYSILDENAPVLARLKGEVTAVDFFLDRDKREAVGIAQISR